jgi:hypothetical protein
MTETESFVLTIPTATRFQGVATLVLGGIGTRLDLPYERMDDLQLAVLSLLAAGADDDISVEVDAGEGAMSVSVGPLAVGSASDEGLARVLGRLADSVEPVQRDGKEWLTIRLVFRPPVDRVPENEPQPEEPVEHDEGETERDA